MFVYNTKKRDQYYDKVISIYQETGYGGRRISKMIPIGERTIARWIANFVTESEKPMVMKEEEMTSTAQEATSQEKDDVTALKAKIAELEEKLKYNEMRADAYDMMIDIAEKKFNIPIRKKVWRQTVTDLHAKADTKYTMAALCGLFGVSKQAYYQYDEDIALAKAAREEFALQYIKDIRSLDPGIGGVKLWYMYHVEFGCDYPIGRDRFCRILDEHGLKIRLKIRKPRTTDSTHGLPTYPNLIKGFVPTAPNQLWVSDITYIVIMDDDHHYHFCYLSMILDAYTEGIVGWSVGPTLDTTYPLEALKMALKRIEGKEINLIHHSDRGCQYVSREYVGLLKEHGISISMTESGDPKDNAQAERINNTMKNELLKDKVFKNILEVISAVAVAVDFYNNRRPHMSIGMKTPSEMAEATGDRDMRWHSYRLEAIKNSDNLGIPGNCLPLQVCQGSPSGLRPPVNP